MKILKLSSKQILRKTLQVITKGGVVVCPTDTVYGLIADAENKTAVGKIFKLKKRYIKKPLPVFVRDLKMARHLVNINKKQEKILKNCWPGKLTAVLKAKLLKFPKGILSKDKKIGLRIPDHKFLKDLLKKIDRPLVETSANISGKKALTKAKEVLKEFEEQKYQPDLFLDAGNLKPSLPSTVIDLTNLKILRKGQIKKSKILKILNI